MSIIELDWVSRRNRREELSRREKIILANLAEEVTLDDIAEKLYVTRNTVKSQVRSIYRKIGVCDRAGAIAYARQVGLRAA
jgi:DNA-binding NarL/FixJ family response regulator